MDLSKAIPPSMEDYVFSLALCLFIIWHKVVLTSFYKARLKVKAVKDTSLFGGGDGDGEQVEETDDDLVKLLDDNSASYELLPAARWSNIHRNDIENILPFLMAVSVYENGGLRQLFGGIMFLVLFTYSRLAHTTMYANAIQPWRSVFFATGLFSNLILVFWSALSTSISSKQLYQDNNNNNNKVSSSRSLYVIQQMTYDWVFVVLVLKIYLVHLGTVLARVTTGNFASPEDRRPTILQERDKTFLVERYLNIARNDVENILPFFVASFLWNRYLSSKEEASSDIINIAGICLFCFFCFTRVAHTIAYICGLQPWRFIFYLLGCLTVTTMLVWNIVYTTLYDSSPLYPIKITVLVCWTFLIMKMYFIAALTQQARWSGGILAAPEDRIFASPVTEQDVPELMSSEKKIIVERLISTQRDDLHHLILLSLTTTLLFSWGLDIFNGYDVDFWGISSTFFIITILRTTNTLFQIVPISSSSTQQQQQPLPQPQTQSLLPQEEEEEEEEEMVIEDLVGRKPQKKSSNHGFIFILGHFVLGITFYWSFVRVVLGIF